MRFCTLRDEPGLCKAHADGTLVFVSCAAKFRTRLLQSCYIRAFEQGASQTIRPDKALNDWEIVPEEGIEPSRGVNPTGF